MNDEDDTRKFMRAFLTGRIRESRLATFESERLQRSHSAIIDVVRSNQVEVDNDED